MDHSFEGCTLSTWTLGLLNFWQWFICIPGPLANL